MVGSDPKIKKWPIFLGDAKEAFSKVLMNPIIVIYFLSVVVLVGSFGVWINFIGSDDCFTKLIFDKNIIETLSTYLISILAGTMASFLISKRDKSVNIKILSFSSFIMAFIFCLAAIMRSNLYLVLSGLVLTYIHWIFVYSEDELMNDNDNDSKSAVGGSNPGHENILGDLGGFKV